MLMLKATLKESRIVRFQKAIDVICRTNGNLRIYWIFTDKKLLIVLFDQSKSKMRQIFEFRSPFFSDYDIPESFSMAVETENMKSLNKILFNFHRLNIVGTNIRVEREGRHLGMTVSSDCSNVQILQKYRCSRIDFDEVQQFENFIEQKMDNKALFLITNINTLESLHLFTKGSLLFEFHQQIVAIRDSLSVSNSLQISPSLFKNYDIKTYDWVMQDTRGLLLPSSEISHLIRVSNRMGILLLSFYLNVKISGDNTIDLHMIGDSHHQTYYKCITASIVQGVREGAVAGAGQHSASLQASALDLQPDLGSGHDFMKLLEMRKNALSSKHPPELARPPALIECVEDQPLAKREFPQPEKIEHLRIEDELADIEKTLKKTKKPRADRSPEAGPGVLDSEEEKLQGQKTSKKPPRKKHSSGEDRAGADGDKKRRRKGEKPPAATATAAAGSLEVHEETVEQILESVDNIQLDGPKEKKKQDRKKRDRKQKDNPDLQKYAELDDEPPARPIKSARKPDVFIETEIPDFEL